MPESEHTRPLLDEDNEPIKLVDGAARAVWEPRPARRTKAQRQAIRDEIRKRIESKRDREKSKADE